MSASGLSTQRLGKLHDVMAGHVERGYLPGLVTLVSRRGEVHVDAIGNMGFAGADADRKMQRDTIFRIASMTKPIVAAAAMILVEECKLRLDDPVDELLPELVNRKVLKRLDSPLDDTVPAVRAITLRDLLTFRLGIGFVLAPPGRYPIQHAIAEAGLSPGPNSAGYGADEWMKRLGNLPLIHQPGTAWMYHTGSDVLGVLIARASGQSLASYLHERIFAPLGMRDTGFEVSAEKLGRLPPSYAVDPKSRKLVVHDDPRESRFRRTPAFASGGGGLVSTADDYAAFCQMMLNKGRLGRERILSRPAVELMTTDHLTTEQRAGAHVLFGANSSWGLGLAVTLRRDDIASVPGRFGWDGGAGTSAYSDPAEALIGVLLTQRMMDSPQPPPTFVDFWTSVYQAIDD
jgi:CubicO group peptidase (beta-lactamase class C family)